MSSISRHFNFFSFKLKANALIKRGSMRMQQQNTDKAESDFTQAIGVDSDNCDVYHHRGQVNAVFHYLQLNMLTSLYCVSPGQL